MITNLFLNVIAISLSTSLMIVFLLIFAPLLNKRYAIKWKYLIWVVIAVRLIIPFHIGIPLPQMVINVPAEITVPIGADLEGDAPITPSTEEKPVEIPPENVINAPLQTAQNPSQKPFTLTLLDITAYLWLTGCLLFLSVHIFSFLHYKRQIAKKGLVVQESYVLQQVCKISKKLQMKPNIRILRYQDAESPMVIGFLKPELILPDCDYSQEELFFILKHELIHIKRHDIYFKLLFVMANAVHWFNPFIYMMQREAVVDMELSCDERVIQNTSYAVRKAYTETLFSTFSRQHKKGTFLTTQFYGGKTIMKKRFQNILTKAPKKNGFFVCTLTICVTFMLGMLIGCSAINEDSPEAPIQTDLPTTTPGIDDTPDTQTEDHNAQAENDSVQTENDDAQTDNADDGSIDISDDTPHETVADPEEPPLTLEDNTYKSVLLGKSNFICPPLSSTGGLNISEIGRAVTVDESAAVSATKFAVLDLDGDGEDEVVLWLQNGTYDCGFEVLHSQNGEIYGYTLWYREFMELKTDGTFVFSGGAADSGIGKISFSEIGYNINKQAYSQSEYNAENELTVQYFIDNESCSESEFHDMLNAQEQKANVEWYDLSESNINAVL